MKPSKRLGVINLLLIAGLAAVLIVGIVTALLFRSQSKISQLGNISAATSSTSANLVTNPTTTFENSLSATSTNGLSAATSSLGLSVSSGTVKMKNAPKISVVNPTSTNPSPGVNVSSPAVTTTVVTTTTATSTQGESLPAEIAIDPQTIVGVLCYYNVTVTSKLTGASAQLSEQQEIRGSGVIYDSKGDILTNRHIIEQPESLTTITDNNGNAIPIIVDYQLDHCEVGQLPLETHLPTVQEIQTINPYVQIPVLGYVAQPFYISPTNGRSDSEIQNADFALLKITGVTKSGPTFGVSSVPSSFPYAKLLPIKQYPQISGYVITYGFPGNVTIGQHNGFETLTMTGSVGRVTGIDFGDTYYADTPLTIHTNMEIAHGRSGSPLFWRGYVIGLVFRFYGDSILDSGSVASDAILKLKAVQN